MLTEHCNTPQAAVILATDEETLRYWRRVGQGPPFRRFSRRLIRYHVPSLMAWAEQQTHNGNSHD